MSRGAILFAFNSPTTNYYKMAEFAAKRISKFLDLPVSLVTDKSSVTESPGFKFDKIFYVDPDTDNKRSKDIWINKGRYQAYEISPYDETLLLDVDYIVNSDNLLKTFEMGTDFCCHESMDLLFQPNSEQASLSNLSYNILWATVVQFKKTKRVKHIFECMEMIQKNYDHYAYLHNFISGMYRNDYALTLAVRIANGHFLNKADVIPWNLLHVGENTNVYKNSDSELDTEYTVLFDRWNKGKIRKEYITIKDLDFHVLNKGNIKTWIEGS